jgi:D-glycero-alpha-D-manno-heptose 1-phosphate guanylyltransferase
MEIQSEVAVILVGGLGTRIRHIIGDVPKPLARVCNEPWLSWIFKSLQAKGFQKVYLLTGFGAQQIVDFVNSLDDLEFAVECVQENKLLGTGGSVVNWLCGLKDPPPRFFLLNGDSLLLDFDMHRAIDSLDTGFDGVIYGRYLSDASRYGTLELDNHNRLVSFREKVGGSGVINTGVYLFQSQAFDRALGLRGKAISLENEIIPQMIKDRETIFVQLDNQPFIDIGVESSLKEAESFIQNHILLRND